MVSIDCLLGPALLSGCATGCRNATDFCGQDVFRGFDGRVLFFPPLQAVATLPPFTCPLMNQFEGGVSQLCALCLC